MQQTQQREITERISWARAMVFGVGFFFLAALLVGQLPSFISRDMTQASLAGFDQDLFSLAAICLAGFVVIQVIVMLFDPKPVVPPAIFSAIGTFLSVAGLALLLWALFTGNQYFPATTTSWNPLLGGKVLWFQPGAIDFVMLGAVVMGVGVAMIFYGVLAMREQTNPDRSDPGTTPAIRGMIIAGIVLLVAFMFFNTFINDQGLAYQIEPSNFGQAQTIIDAIINVLLGIAIFCVLGAFALRLHYLMRPVRKRTMSQMYAVATLGLAQVGAIFLLSWIVLYPVLTWIHSWTFIGLGSYLTVCARKAFIPQSCSFSQQASYIIDTVISTTSFAILMAAVYMWKSNRNLVIVGGVVIATILALATLVVHMSPDQIFVAFLLCGGGLVLATVWTTVARREFAVVGENNLGCLGMWLVVGTCLLVYVAAFGFFSIPGFHETEPNITFVSGTIIGVHAKTPVLAAPDAVVTFVLMGILAAIQFYFLVRNRYKV
ncbi:MAG TPA: hypothetical protein VKR42_11110 [Ktedonobacteraceae bacterium]|nr:hypothetical protein [Ktedonobacteraceae bacterium]